MKLGKKAKVSFITVVTAFSFLIGGSVVPAKTDNTKGKEWVDLNNDGMVDKERLTPEERKKSDKRTADIDAYIEKMASKKAKIRAQKKQLKENKKDKSLTKDISKLEAELKSLEKNMEKDIGLVEAAEVPIKSKTSLPSKTSLMTTKNYTTLASTSADVDLKGKIYKDAWNKGRWVVESEWEWRNSDWQSDRKGTGNVGKLDGFGLIVDEDIDIYSHKINTYWSYDGSKSTPGTIYNDKSEDDNGWGWKWQDRIRWDQTKTGGSVKTYSGDYGIATMSVKFENKKTAVGSTVEATARYGHTYNETTISDVTFSNSGIGFTYNKSSGRWSDTENWPIKLK
ncbi:hypothetical protein [Peribacillus simplex]|uniref:hypothetical protein n=1 Tax=Peribacillus simplex TaxID=1478 RepID=UPI00333B2128